MRALVVLGSVLAVSATASAGDLVITEVQASSDHTGPANGDWWELTNIGVSAINLTGYQWYDDVGGLNSDSAIFGNVSIAAGESIIIVDENTASLTAWKASWGLGSSSVQVLANDTFTGANPFSGLSATTDQVNLIDGFGALVASVAFGASAPAGQTHEWATDGSSLGFSVIGENGAYQTFDNGAGAAGIDVGSPGVAVPAPGALALLGIAGLVGSRRRRTA